MMMLNQDTRWFRDILLEKSVYGSSGVEHPLGSIIAHLSSGWLLQPLRGDGTWRLPPWGTTSGGPTRCYDGVSAEGRSRLGEDERAWWRWIRIINIEFTTPRITTSHFQLADNADAVVRQLRVSLSRQLHQPRNLVRCYFCWHAAF